MRRSQNGWDLFSIGELSSSVRVGVVDWTLDHYEAVRYYRSEVMIAHATSPVLTVRTQFTFSAEKQQRFRTVVLQDQWGESDVVPVKEMHCYAPTYLEAMDNHWELAAPILGLLEAKEEMLLGGGRPVMLEGVL